MAERSIRILVPGALTTIQDLGRPGRAHLGVPRSGALDAPALRLANRLVGNSESSAGLETTLTGLSFVAEVALRFAVTGAVCAVLANGREHPWGAAVSVPEGAEVTLGPARVGLRSYVGFAGGVVVPTVLGSRSTDLLSGLGPPPLTAGDRLPIGESVATAPMIEVPPIKPRDELPMDLGPRQDWLTPESIAALDGSSYLVAAASNRIGLRLVGPVLERRSRQELPSEPMVLGSVQVPPNGQPVIFLADHPTTGGYPVIGVVRAEGLVSCAQARPGDRLTLRVLPAPHATPGHQPES